MWQELALDTYQKRCQERIAKSNAMHAAEIVELKKREEKERLQAIELTRLRETQILQHSEEISHIEDIAGTSGSTSEIVTNTTSPLLLDAIITHLSEPTCNCSPIACTAYCRPPQELLCARCERDNALTLARQYRDLAEESRTKIRQQKYHLEEKVELVRNMSWFVIFGETKLWKVVVGPGRFYELLVLRNNINSRAIGACTVTALAK